MSSYTPMMQQYLEIKKQYEDCILFFRLGDFYEMFFSDAEIASRELEITLTGRDCGAEERAPMCGVPFHSADSYIAKLVSKGYKVAICEQMEDPSAAKGIVKREVVRVVTPGTITDSNMLEDKKNNYICSIYAYSSGYGLAVADISTGDFLCTNIVLANTNTSLIDELSKYFPSEIIANKQFENDSELFAELKQRFNAYITILEEDLYKLDEYEQILKKQFQKEENEIPNFSIANSIILCAGALLNYLYQTQKTSLLHIKNVEIYDTAHFMELDASTRRNLELVETLRDKAYKGSLLWVIDRTKTSLGARNLRKWIEQPLVNIEMINMRLNAIKELKENFMSRMRLMEELNHIYDIERLNTRIVLGTANPRDIIALRNSLARLPAVKDILANFNAELLKNIYIKIDCMQDICELINKAIIDEPPVAMKDGGIIKNGYNENLDKLRDAITNGKKWIIDFENTEKEKTGIKNLKVGFNKVFGYYIEVTKSYFNLVPDYYIRKQTLANCERYITQELKEMEDMVLGAEEKIMALEYELYIDIRNKIASESERIKNSARAVADIDTLCSLADTADRENYCMPEVNANDIIEIKDGRHPVVEKMLPANTFVPNDTYLDMHENRLCIITGPNMAGKSTYMRQTALIVLLAQIGSYVPASKAVIGIADRIFTRVGASDDIASGHSTFMVEMSEVANILRNSTSRSLLILDEIGRGTSTYDGLSIAWAVVEHISNSDILGARTLFATHYRELTELEGKLTGVKNYCVAVKEKGDDIIFLRKIIRGGADASYGIQVAKLAGVPDEVIERAKELLKELEDADISKKNKTKKGKMHLDGQIDLFSFIPHKNALNDVEIQILSEIRALDLNKITPLEALNKLYDIQKKLSNKD